MAIRVKCPHCRKPLVAPVQLSGQERTCPHCGGKVILPIAKIPIVADQDPHHAHDAASPSHDWFNTPKAQSNPNDLIDMTAMVDIVFFLLIYFLVTSFVALSAAIQSPASEATVGKTAKSDSEKKQAVQPLTVRVDPDGIVWVEGEPVQSAHDLVQRLKKAKDETGADGLRIAASPDATHGKVVMVLDSGLAAGFKEAQLALEEMQ